MILHYNTHKKQLIAFLKNYNTFLPQLFWGIASKTYIFHFLMVRTIYSIQMLSFCYRSKQNLKTSSEMFLEVVLKRDFPAFITTYIYEDHTFLNTHTKQTEAPRSKLWSVK